MYGMLRVHRLRRRCNGGSGAWMLTRIWIASLDMPLTMTVLGLRRRLVLRVLHHLNKGLLVVCLGEQLGASAQGDRALTEMLRGRGGTS